MSEWDDIIIANSEEKAKDFLDLVRDRDPLFLCVGGTSETAKIPGLSMAGKNPDFTDYTPVADLEILVYGQPKTIAEVPTTPEGIPTPALITSAAIDIAEISSLVANAGMEIIPSAPYLDLCGTPGRNIREELAVEKPSRIFENARIIGMNLSNHANFLLIGETIPGGTTTALGVLEAMGVEASGRVSSSMPTNPHHLKSTVVSEGLESSGLNSGELAEEPLGAIRRMGDPMIPAVAGLAAGAGDTPVLLAGGTQMAAVLKVISVLEETALDNLGLGTTRWIIQDEDSDIISMTNDACDVPVLASNLDFSRSKYDGLKAYEEGFVKEGVGAGGASLAAMLKKEEVDSDSLLKEVEAKYEELVE